MAIGELPTSDAEPQGTIAGPTVSTRDKPPMQDTLPPGVGHHPPCAASLGTGSMLAGYRLLQKLGEGGMGAVYMAEDVALRRHVALKVMRQEIASCDSSKQRFLREARAAACLQHDNVVGIHQVGEDNGIAFLAMPLLKGESLGKRLQRDTSMPVPVILNLGRDIADGLSAAHELGLVHRDIKPDNIWIEPLPKARGERAKILDFGLVRPATEDESLVTQQGAVLGTPAYMSPEQACGMNVDHRSDLFSLGGVLYKMATGRRPFNGRNAIEVLSNLATETPPTPVSLVPGMLPELSDLIMKLLEKEPANRPATAQEVAETFRTMQPENMVVVIAKPENSAAPWAISDADSDMHSMPTDNVTLPDSRKIQRSGPTPKSTTKSKSRQPLESLPLLEVPPARRGSGMLWKLALCALVGGGIIGGLWAMRGKPQPDTSPVVIAELPKSPIDESPKIVIKDKEIPPAKEKEPISTKDKHPEIKNPAIVDPGPELLVRPREVEVRVVEVALPYPREVRPTMVVIELPKKIDPPIDVVGPPKKKDIPDDKVVVKPKVTGYALQFGEGSSVLVPTLKLDRAGSYTIEAYVTPGARNLAGMNAIVWVPGQTALAIPFSFWSFTAFPEGVAAGVAVKAPVKEQKRTHVAAVRNDKQIMLFIDGKLIVSRDCPKDKLIAPKDVLMIGASPGPKISSFDGLIDEVRISRMARYAKDFDPLPRFNTDRDTMALYHFDEGQGDTLKDATANDHHGTITGARWVHTDGSAIIPFKLSGPLKDSDRPKRN